jgi:small subunit ribosomal protein S11
MNKAKQKKQSTVKKNRTVVIDASANAHIHATFNNIIITFANKKGDAISWASAGKMGFKGAKKNTPYAAKCAAESSCAIAHSLGVRKVDLFVNGPGLGREAAIRSIESVGIIVESITDNTSIPFNGCRPPKRRRP